MFIRYALVSADVDQVAAYLPDNYRVIGSVDGQTVIAGRDVAGEQLIDASQPRTICQLDQRLGARPGAGPGSTAKDASASCASTSVSFRSRARRQPHRAAARGNVPGSRSNSAGRIASASASPTGPGSSATSARCLPRSPA